MACPANLQCWHLMSLTRAHAITYAVAGLFCRLLMQETASALAEASSLVKAADVPRIGVYAGCMYQEYLGMLSHLGGKFPPQAIVGSGNSYLVGRLSFTFGLNGPCISTDTACSSSLVAAHLAHTGLIKFESTASVVAGSNIMLSVSTTAAICQLQVGKHLDCYVMCATLFEGR